MAMIEGRPVALGGEGSREVSGAVRAVRRGRFTVTRLHRNGMNPHRVLLLGSQALLGARRRPHVEAFGDRIADRVWLRTQRGLDLDVLWEFGPVVRAIGEGLSSWRLWRYDAVVVVLASHPVGMIARWRSRGAQRLLQRLLGEVGRASDVVVVWLVEKGKSVTAGAARTAADPVAGANGPNGAARVSWLSISMDAQDGPDAVAVALRAPLEAADSAGRGETADAAHRRRLGAGDEGHRQAAVDELGLHDREVERRLQLVLRMAQATFETESAEITIIDHDRRWTMAASGASHEDLPRGASLGDLTRECPAPTVIADTWRVLPLRGNPLVTGPHAVRFYAAYPIESIDGYRVGLLCVWDRVPHTVDRFDVSALRDLALLAEGEIMSAGADIAHAPHRLTKQQRRIGDWTMGPR